MCAGMLTRETFLGLKHMTAAMGTITMRIFKYTQFFIVFTEYSEDNSEENSSRTLSVKIRTCEMAFETI